MGYVADTSYSRHHSGASSGREWERPCSRSAAIEKSVARPLLLIARRRDSGSARPTTWTAAASGEEAPDVALEPQSTTIPRV